MTLNSTDYLIPGIKWHKYLANVSGNFLKNWGFIGGVVLYSYKYGIFLHIKYNWIFNFSNVF
jgi:hypothetical protein